MGLCLFLSYDAWATYAITVLDRHANDDIGGYYHSASGTPDNIVRGRYGSRSPASGQIEETVYTAGPRGWVSRTHKQDDEEEEVGGGLQLAKLKCGSQVKLSARSRISAIRQVRAGVAPLKRAKGPGEVFTLRVGSKNIWDAHRRWPGEVQTVKNVQLSVVVVGCLNVCCCRLFDTILNCFVAISGSWENKQMKQKTRSISKRLRDTRSCY